MTKKSFSKAFKSIIVFLSVLCLLCTCAFAVACGNDSDSSSDDTETTYIYNETNTETISNRLFKYGTYDKTEDDFPMTSAIGWTKSVDNSAASSTVDSGVISVASNDAWDKVFDKLYAKSDFVKVYKNKYPTDLADDKTDEEKKAFIKTQLVNPEKHTGAEDNYIYMLNNFVTSTVNTGTAQRLRSSSSVSVKKGEIYKVSVWVYTNIISAGGHNQGANIRFTNAVNGNSQTEFRIDKIDTAKTWKEYTVYFVAHEDYDCTFTLTLGLGYGNADANTKDYVMGTAFFDDVTVEKIEAAAVPAAFDSESTLIYGAKDPISVDATGKKTFKYDMNFDTTDYFTASADADINETLTHESKTVTIDNGGANFTITTADENYYEKYMLVSFKLQNKLNKLGSTDITVNVKDIYGTLAPVKRDATTFSTVNDGDEFTTCNIIVRNNFKAQDTNNIPNDEYLTRKFYLEIVIGPTDATASTPLSEYATGTVTIKDIKYSDETKAACNGYVSSEKYDDKTDDPNYKLYSFFNSNADATVALYAGYDADYSEHNHDSFTLTPAKSNIGEITAHPTAVNGYDGITADHFYVKSGSTVTAINGRNNFSANGYAGLINTKYLTTAYNAQDANLAGKLAGLYTDENNIQPIVIYNNYTDNKDNHYGYVGTSQTVAASSYAKVTVKLKVFDNAKAYIYLVDTSKGEKDIMQFIDFKVNTADGLKNAAIIDHEYSAADHKFMLTVGSGAEVGDDKWVTASFYIATGAETKSFRVEVWNGGRDGQDATASTGYVVINSIEVKTSSAFTEPTSWQSALDGSDGSPLASEQSSSFDGEGRALIAYARKLTDKEKEFNKEYPDKAVSYEPTYVWANNANMIYAVFNTIDPVEHNPYDDITPEEEGSGCSANTDPSAFWMSFSSIMLAVVLVGAIVALFIKRYAAKRKANKSDAVSQYKVKSRSETQKAINKAKAAKEKKSEIAEEPTEDIEAVETETAEPVVSPDESATENTETADNADNAGDDTEQSGYVYGEVQDFGDMSLEMPEENKTEEKPEEDAEDKKDE